MQYISYRLWVTAEHIPMQYENNFFFTFIHSCKRVAVISGELLENKTVVQVTGMSEVFSTPDIKWVLLHAMVWPCRLQDQQIL